MPAEVTRLPVGAFMIVPSGEIEEVEVIWAEQLAVEPPLEPAQDQLQGPLPETVDAVPAEQRPVVGLLVREAPFDPPQLPLTAVLVPAGAEDDAQALPVQIHQPLTLLL